MKKIFKTKANDRAFDQNDKDRTSLFAKIRFSQGLRGGRKRRKGKKIAKKVLRTASTIFEKGRGVWK